MMVLKKTKKRMLKTDRFFGLIITLIFLIIITALFTLMLGTPKLTIGELVGILMGGGDEKTRLVVMELRLPRLVLGILAGVMLALSGVLLQDSMRNALAGPELLGVSAGAAVVMAVIIVLHVPIAFALQPWITMLGGFIGGGIVLRAARNNPNPIHLVLIGAAVSALLFSIVIAVISYGSETSVALLYQFLTGTLAARTWDYVQVLLPSALLGIPLALLCAERLNIIRMGDETAKGLGLNVKKTRMFIMFISVLLVATVVSTSDPISYIALLTPHLARRLLKTEKAQKVLPVAALLGALVLTTADLVSHRMFAPQEIPVGIWTTIVGGPILLVLLQQKFKGVRQT
jgi:iron complex transport system permease protein